jgi:hypothetical protein
MSCDGRTNGTSPVVPEIRDDEDSESGSRNLENAGGHGIIQMVLARCAPYPTCSPLTIDGV